ncbi:molybdopterin-dependent oxidoreductase [Nocardioides sp. HM23]|uniref:molybdopterin-containing oxidoreductase family protein n=1 Tax=Nocardioides bizhenqiangii TaxID=3095076 RepID=UPI002ACAD089|nr:molybdopterin-dependent oxidoreductase [Nocardioides sp. HM23]MDZ5623250.1 molybdopterin-dependent oxidoreductase [Nocardioides sp. HM23]
MLPAEQPTFCRICEPTCGLIATVEDGRLIKLRPDKEHPITAGFSCPKGLEFVHVQNDQDRLLHPLRRRQDGGFEQISWETALSEIGARLREIRREHGGESIGWYGGNPTAFSHSHALWLGWFLRGIGSRHLYTPNTQDTSSRFVASALLYGSPVVVPVPDLDRTDFLLLIGTNPLVSRGSLISAGNLRERFTEIVARGGRVVVVDPRRTETANAFEHVAVRPDGDAWLLLAMLHVIFTEALADEAAIAAQTTGIEALRAAADRCPPELAEPRCGVPAADIRGLARAFATAPTAAAHGRTGACLGAHATLVNYLIDALTIVTGNLDKEGGLLFGRGTVDLTRIAHLAGVDTYDTYRSRIGDLPEVIGQLPAPLMAAEIETPGKGQLRALIVSAGNPVLSVPGSTGLERALGKLDLQVGIDLYLNETHKHADYVLPAATFLERDDLVIAALDFHLKPFVQWTEAVVPPRGEARPDWEIIDDIAGELGFAAVSGLATKLVGTGRLGRLALRAFAPAAGRVTPALLIDLLIRTGRDGDRFGLRRGGLSLKKLKANPRGVVLAEHLEGGMLRRRVFHRGHQVRLDGDVIERELDRLLGSPPPDVDYPLLLIGRRDVRSHNSWMHNTPKHRDPSRRQWAMVHPKDAADIGLSDGELVRVRTAKGSIEVPARVTDEVVQGCIAVPHGWGHLDGGWQIANAAGGANVNEVLPAEAADLERASGMAHLNGVPVRIEAAAVSG